MFNNGSVVPQTQFNNWAAHAVALYASIKPYANRPPDKGGAPFAYSYLPEPTRRAG
jgi:hypothetical protein